MRMIDLPLGAIRGAGFLFLLLSLAAVMCAVFAFGKPKAAGYCILSALIAPLSFLPVSLFENYSVRMNFPTSPVSAVTIWGISLPVWIYSLAAALFAAAELLIATQLRRRIHMALTEQSIREGLDQLPDGVCFSLPDGFPRLVNDRMQQISSAAFGEGVTDARLFDLTASQQALLPGCAVKTDNDNTFLLLPDGKVWQIQQRGITADRKPFTETIAYDATTRFHSLQELKTRNERLTQVNRRLRDYLEHIDRTVREKEILAAKIRLHNRLGECLLAMRSYLTGVEGDRATITEQLQQTAALLQNNEPDVPATDRLQAVLKAAQAVGVEIRITGELPPAHKELLEVAIHECLTNTVKHAQGHLLEVGVTQDGDGVTVTLTNDGKPPAGPVQETGGLRNLRAMTQAQGGTMEIESTPAFRLILRFPRGEADTQKSDETRKEETGRA
ncbi:MAG: ATP-binding protein [Clostridia bacterium]|nr:ATP-binding protein [Clostridia bacterium]